MIRTQRFLHNVSLGLAALRTNPGRTFLTALGIIFGVASVISMLAIGAGARAEILRQIDLVGRNTVSVVPSSPQESAQEKSTEEKEDRPARLFGLTYEDCLDIPAGLPSVECVSPLVTYDGEVRAGSLQMPAQLVGCEPSYFEIFNLRAGRGRLLLPGEGQASVPACVIGDNVRVQLFGGRQALGDHVCFGDVWYEVVGQLRHQPSGMSVDPSFGLVDVNDAIFVSYRCLAARYRDRSRLVNDMRGRVYAAHKNGQQYLDGIVLRIRETPQMEATVSTLHRMLSRRHGGNEDFSIVVPEQLLAQEQRTRDIFNVVLGAIAGISLLVGGIGIMNIMYATVLERIGEIGLRLAIGAQRRDIIIQFLSESVLISLSGGLVGLLTGFGLARIISFFSGIEILFTLEATLVAFLVSAGVGVIFGISPAHRAARQTPIEALHHD